MNAASTFSLGFARLSGPKIETLGRLLNRRDSPFAIRESEPFADGSPAIESESFYPNNLAPERITELRVIECERLTKLWQKAQLALDQIQPRLGSDGERNLDAVAVARLIEPGTRVSERISRLFGLDQPTKVIEEQLRVSYQKTESKVLISFDRSPIEALARQPVPGLSVTVGGSLNGNGKIADALPNAPINDSSNNGDTEQQLQSADTVPVAGELPTD
jgi:hypothetical protein